MILCFINDDFINMQTGDGVGSLPLKLHYFDQMLKENMTGMALCNHSETSPQTGSPLVTCGAAQVTVTLPQGAKLKKVKDLGKDCVSCTFSSLPQACLIIGVWKLQGNFRR